MFNVNDRVQTKADDDVFKTVRTGTVVDVYRNGGGD